MDRIAQFEQMIRLIEAADPYTPRRRWQRKKKNIEEETSTTKTKAPGRRGRKPGSKNKPKDPNAPKKTPSNGRRKKPPGKKQVPTQVAIGEIPGTEEQQNKFRTMEEWMDAGAPHDVPEQVKEKFLKEISNKSYKVKGKPKILDNENRVILAESPPIKFGPFKGFRKLIYTDPRHINIGLDGEHPEWGDMRGTAHNWDNAVRMFNKFERENYRGLF